MELPCTDSAKVVEQALSFQPPDRLPVYNSFWEFETAWRRAYGLPADVPIEDYYWLDLHVSVATEAFFPSRIREVERRGEDIYFDDGWGRIKRRREGAYFSETVERLLEKPADLDRIVFESPQLDARYVNFVEDAARHRQKGRAVFVKIGGPFIRSSFFRGETQFLMDLAADEGFAKALVERTGEHLLQVGLESLRRASAYNFGVWIYDDMCSIDAPMFSPGTFERILLPTYKRIVSRLKAAGARWVIFHSDGNQVPLLDMLLEAGIDGINPVEPSAGMDAVALLEQYAGRLRIVGGVCNTRVLPRGDREAIRRHVAPLVEAGRDGGLIIGTASISPEVPVASYEYFRQLVAKLGAYKG